MAALEQQQQQPSVQTQRLEYSHNVQRWMTKHGQRERVEQARDKMVMLRRWFELLDTDKSGEIGLSELEEPLVSTGLARSRQVWSRAVFPMKCRSLLMEAVCGPLFAGCARLD